MISDFFLKKGGGIREKEVIISCVRNRSEVASWLKQLDTNEPWLPSVNLGAIDFGPVCISSTSVIKHLEGRSSQKR